MMQYNIFGGLDEAAFPDSRLLLRISVRLSPDQKNRFFEFCSRLGRTPSEVVREKVLEVI